MYIWKLKIPWVSQSVFVRLHTATHTILDNLDKKMTKIELTISLDY